MPETSLGIVYPDSSGHTRLWEHFQALAESTDAAISAVDPVECKLIKTSNQSFPDGVNTRVTWNAAEFDTDGMADIANNRILIQTPGTYLVNAQLVTAGATTTTKRLWLNVNGSLALQEGFHGVGSTSGINVNGIMRLAAGDRIEVNYELRGQSLDMLTSLPQFLAASMLNPAA